MTLTAVPGVRVGHWTDAAGVTGVTVVDLPEPNITTAEFRGAAPGSRETALLAPGMRVESVQALVLCGGSAFGLAAADGVVAALEAEGRGHRTAFGVVPIVPAAVMIRQPSAFFVAETSPLKTWADVEREARKRPLKVAITGFGSADDLHVIFFKGKGYQFTAVPFPKPAERYSSVLGGHADLLYEQLGDVKSFLDGKQMRPILIFSEARFPAFGNVPASYELGHQIAISQFRAIAMKAGTDAQRVNAVSGALAKVAATDDYKAWLKDQYADEKSFIGADGAVAFMNRELETMRKYAPKK